MGILYYSQYRMTRLLPLIIVLIFSSYTKSQEKEKVILINGGWNGENVLNSTEILGGTLPCKVPNLPEMREFNKNVFGWFCSGSWRRRPVCPCIGCGLRFMASSLVPRYRQIQVHCCGDARWCVCTWRIH